MFIFNKPLHIGLYLLHNVLFLASGGIEHYDIYHISANGTDTSTCGKTADSACKSLNPYRAGQLFSSLR